MELSATEKGRPVCTERPFLSYGSSTLTGDFGPLHRGPISQPRPTRGPLQIGAVATASRTDTMVSHLRKMERLNRGHPASTRTRRKLSPLLTGRARMISAECRDQTLQNDQRVARAVRLTLFKIIAALSHAVGDMAMQST